MSGLETSLGWALTHLAPDLIGWEREFYFAAPRKFRADFAFPASRLLIEVQGGIYMAKGAHTGASLTRDYAKLNAAAIRGYRMLMFGPKDLTKRMLPETLDVIREALIAPR